MGCAVNNFIAEVDGFDGLEAGSLHSLRELLKVASSLGYTHNFFIKEQSFALISLVVLCVGVIGVLDSLWGVYLSSLIIIQLVFILGASLALLSVVFHYLR
ncbi:hypothetical protein PCO87_00630 [Pectobacteriaceae bacterium C52]|nr:hypothetical protein PCO87_00630 [Pectobacteriaceae bacterium C52]